MKLKEIFSFKQSPVPAIILLGLLLIFLTVSLLAVNRSPFVHSIEPDIGEPGELIVITGENFGEKRGTVHFGEAFPLDSEYLTWTNTEIKVTVPFDAPSGALWIETDQGSSARRIFTNRNHLPVIAQGPQRPGEPFIEDISPHRGGVGDIVTITGGNFGEQRADSAVFFPWISRQDSGIASQLASDYLIEASSLENDYISWSNTEIKVRVPDGAASGNIFVSSKKGQSNSSYIEISDSIGSRVLSNKQTYNMQLSALIRQVTAEGENSMNVWVPTGLVSPNQRDLQIVSQVPEASEVIPAFSRFAFDNLKTGEIYGITQDILLDVYQVQTKVNPNKVSWNFDVSSYVYKTYTKRDNDMTALYNTSQYIIGRTGNPYWAAEKVYDYILDKFSYARMENAPLLTTLYSKKGNAYTLSRLFVAMMRNKRLPARMVAGVVIDPDKKARPHYWAEYYISDVGWIPVDVASAFNPQRVMGRIKENSRSFFFGGITEYHIAFTKGVLSVPRIHEQSSLRDGKDIPYSLQETSVELVGDIKNYTLLWGDILILGIY